MTVQGISDLRLLKVVPVQSGISAETNELFLASMALYLTQLHLLIIQSWKRFGETRRKVAQENDSLYRNREQRKIEAETIRLEGEKREKVLLQTIYRQAGKFRYFQGHYLAGETRHLNLPI